MSTSLITIFWGIFFVGVVCRTFPENVYSKERCAYWAILFGLHTLYSIVSKEKFALTVLGLILTGGIAGCYGMLQSFPVVNLHTYATNVAGFGNVNFAAAYLAPTLLLSLPILFCAQERVSIRQRFLHVMAFGAALCYLLLTGCRASWLAFMSALPISVFIFLVKGRVYSKISFINIGIALLVISGLLIFFKPSDNFIIERVASITNWEKHF